MKLNLFYQNKRICDCAQFIKRKFCISEANSQFTHFTNIVYTIKQIGFLHSFDCIFVWLICNSKLFGIYIYHLYLFCIIREIVFRTEFRDSVTIFKYINRHLIKAKAKSCDLAPLTLDKVATCHL